LPNRLAGENRNIASPRATGRAARGLIYPHKPLDRVQHAGPQRATPSERCVMSALGHEPTLRNDRFMPALPPKADMLLRWGNVR